MKKFRKFLSDLLEKQADTEDCRAHIEQSIADRFARLGHHVAHAFHVENAGIHQRNAAFFRRVASWVK